MSRVDNASSWNILLDHKATLNQSQENEVTIITAADIQKGDLIKVTTISNDEDRKVSYVYEGVASEQDSWNPLIWRTTSFSNLWAHEAGAVIELLDRPKRRVPILPGAVVKYTFNVLGPEPRTAVRDRSGEWKCYNDAGYEMDAYEDDSSFEEMFDVTGYDFDIVFAGAAK